LKSQGSEKKELKKQKKLCKVFINKISLTTGELKRRKVNFSSMARLEAVNQIKKQLNLSKKQEG